MTKSRIDGAGYERASQTVQEGDKRLSTARARIKDEVAKLSARVAIPMGPGELEYYATQVADLLTMEGRSAAVRFLDPMDLSMADTKKVFEAANRKLQELADESAETAQGLSVARHDQVYEQAMAAGALSVALRAQAGLDRVTGVNVDSDDSEAIRTGILKAMKEVYHDSSDDQESAE